MILQFVENECTCMNMFGNTTGAGPEREVQEREKGVCLFFLKWFQKSARTTQYACKNL